MHIRIKRFMAPEIDGQSADPIQDTEAVESAKVEENSSEPAEIVPTNEWAEGLRDEIRKDPNRFPTDEEETALETLERDGERKAKTVEEPVVKKPEEDKPAGEPSTDKVVEPKTPEETLQKSFDMVGAKSTEELPEKILELRNFYREKAGTDGNVIKEQAETIAQMDSFVAGLKTGDPYVMDWLKKEAPDLFKQQAVQPNTNPAQPSAMDPDTIPEGVIDEVAYKTMAASNTELRNMVKDLAAQVQQTNQGFGQVQANIATTAQQAEIQQQAANRNNQIIGFLNANPDIIPAGSDIQGLVQEYYSGDEKAKVNPVFQKAHELIEYSVSKGFGGNLIAAKTAKGLEDGSFAQQLIDAENRGRESALQHKPNVSLAPNRSQGNGNLDTQEYTEDQVRRIASGELDVPPEWMTADGMGLKPYDQLPPIVEEMYNKSKIHTYGQ